MSVLRGVFSRNGGDEKHPKLTFGIHLPAVKSLEST